MIRAPEAVKRAAKAVGGQASLARKLFVTPTTVSEWATGKRPVPPEHAPEIEELSGVPCEELCPSVPWAKVRRAPPQVAENAARMAFLAEHWASDFDGVRVRDWLGRTSTLLHHGGLLAAIDYLRSQGKTT